VQFVSISAIRFALTALILILLFHIRLISNVLLRSIVLPYLENKRSKFARGPQFLESRRQIVA
jgi:hypothetical protein